MKPTLFWLFAGEFMRSFRQLWIAASVVAWSVAGVIVIATPTGSVADEGGVSFWLPGFFGSLAATPQVPGFSFANMIYYNQVSAGGDVAFARQVPLGNINVNFNGKFNANLHPSAQPLYIAIPRYNFSTPVFSGQVKIFPPVPYGRVETSVDATVTGSFGLGPGFTVGRSLTETVNGFGDILPMATLRWNSGVHNFMTYLTGNLTTGVYHSQSIANLGIGHNAIDAGGA